MNRFATLSFRAAITAAFMLFISGSVIPQTRPPSYHGTGFSYKPTATVYLQLTDTVSPELISHYFRLFRYRVIEANLKQVEAVIQEPVSDDDLLRMMYHPFVDEITVEHPYQEPFADLEPVIKIHFKRTASDEMIHKFLTIHSGYNIQLEPRIKKSVIITTKYWTPERLVSDLEALIYVNKATIVPNQP